MRLPILLALSLTAALSGCVATSNPLAVALTTPHSQMAFAALDTRTPEEVTRCEQILATLAPGQSQHFLLATGHPIVLTRSATTLDGVSIWMLDQNGILIDIRGHLAFTADHVVLVNPHIVPWHPWEGTHAATLFAEIERRLTI